MPFSFPRKSESARNSVPYVIVLSLVALLASPVRAQRLSFPSYHPGEYAPLRIESDGPGRIEIRGPEMMGIDWDAPGKTSITVPWMCWRTASADVTVTVNGTPQVVSLRPLQQGESSNEANPYAISGKILGPQSAMYSEEAYIPTFSWAPGRPAQARRWIVLAGVLVMLVLLAIRLVLWRSPWTAIVMVAGGVGLAILFPQRSELSRRDSRMTIRIVSSDPPQSDAWIYLTSGIDERLDVAWHGMTMLIPRSASHLAVLEPMMRIDASGAPQAISVRVNAEQSAAVLQRSAEPVKVESDNDDAIAPELVRQLYGRPYTVDRREGAVMRLTPSSPG